MNDPQPISTAPVDGTVILTNVGFVKAGWHINMYGERCLRWTDCNPFGSDYGHDIAPCSPIMWTPVPEWIK